ncbi:hypothetical protein [Candidatus Villigracilis affinis]|uniref:hypothetical protein n=1 Tax=Candidatus Villigracilis affinis TaxID=3140682 RepID=UPI002A23410A|nr:hypothetical protein [Anaerolineales bacterium]
MRALFQLKQIKSDNPTKGKHHGLIRPRVQKTEKISTGFSLQAVLSAADISKEAWIKGNTQGLPLEEHFDYIDPSRKG